MSLICRRKRQGCDQQEEAKVMSFETRQHSNRFSRKCITESRPSHRSPPTVSTVSNVTQ